MAIKILSVTIARLRTFLAAFVFGILFILLAHPSKHFHRENFPDYGFCHVLIKKQVDNTSEIECILSETEESSSESQSVAKRKPFNFHNLNCWDYSKITIAIQNFHPSVKKSYSTFSSLFILFRALLL